MERKSGRVGPWIESSIWETLLRIGNQVFGSLPRPSRLNWGPIGLTCATIAEAELFLRAGIKNVFWTKRPVSVNNIQRTAALSREDPRPGGRWR